MKKEESKKKLSSLKIGLIVLLILGAGIGANYLYYQIKLKNDYPIFGKIEFEATEEADLNVLLSEYLDNINDYYNIDVTLTVFLARGIERSGSGGVYVEYAVDDIGNNITLIDLNREQKELFPKIGKTKATYNVTGKFKKKYQGLDFEVLDIVKSK